MLPQALRARADLLRKLRNFFDHRGLLEVQTPLLSRFTATEPQIDPFAFSPQGPFLITSPEYAMKRLLAAGSGSIYQISSVFRQEERGAKHNPEFTMVEFYLEKQDHLGLMDFVAKLFTEVLDWPTPKKIDYVELYQSTTGLNPLDFSYRDFDNCCTKHQITIPQYLQTQDCPSIDHIDFIFSLCIEPTLGLEYPLLVHNYPAFMCGLSKIDSNINRSTRFEVFYHAMELGNGCFELNQPAEQRNRFHQDNQKRKALGKKQWPLDEPFLDALNHLPDCAGIALGLERILMIQLKTDQINDVLAFPLI